MRAEMLCLLRPLIQSVVRDLTEIGEDLNQKSAVAVIHNLMAQGVALAVTAEALARETDTPIGCTAIEAMRHSTADGATIASVAAAARR
jgi:uncharacterized protein YoaH (UPF0181 family)